MTQYKTVDFANFFQTAERIGAWERGIRESIDKLAATKDPLTGGIPRRVSGGLEIRAIRADEIIETRVEIVVPPRFAADATVASQQQAALQRGLDYASVNLDQVAVRWAN